MNNFGQSLFRNSFVYALKYMFFSILLCLISTHAHHLFISLWSLEKLMSAKRKHVK